MVLEPGNTWPDQFQERAEYTIEQAWVMDLADECRGTGEHDVFVSDGPLADTDSYTSWVEGVVQEHQSSEARRFSLEEQPRLNLRQN